MLQRTQIFSKCEGLSQNLSILKFEYDVAGFHESFWKFPRKLQSMNGCKLTYSKQFQCSRENENVLAAAKFYGIPKSCLLRNLKFSEETTEICDFCK